jgi:hypothetical protein
MLTCVAQSSDALYETAWVVPPATGAGTGTSSAQLRVTGSVTISLPQTSAGCEANSSVFSGAATTSFVVCSSFSACFEQDQT